MPRCRLSQACGNMWRGEDGDEMDQPQSSAAESQSGAKDATRGGGRDKAPRTPTGRRALRKVLVAAAVEFGHRGLHEAAILGITLRRRHSLGRVYSSFVTKETVFHALVLSLSA